MVDPMLPNLGQQPSTRSFVTSTERIRVIHECGATICRNDMYVIFGSLAPVWHADENIWVVQRPALTPRSGCVRILGQHMPLNRVRMAELFCGHMGGWRSATRSMQEWKVQVALDNDEHAVATYNLNYGGRIVRQPEGITTEMAQSELLLCCGVEDFRWLNAFNHKEVECLSVSSPCQSWSLMGSGSGTASPNGEALVTTVQICRLVQPVLILFEQVQGFRQHSEFELFQKTMLEAGFKIAASGVHNLELLSPTTRRRWLAVFINTAHVRRWDILGCFLRPLVRETHNFDPARHCLPMLSDGQLSALQISVDEMKILDDPDLLPRWLKRPFQAASAIHMRIQRGGAPLPTINAAYRKAVCFHKEALGGKGLMSWVIQDAHGDVRWFSKFEALMVMGFPADFILPKDEPHAFQAIGNAISPLQAALVMTFATDVLSVQQGGSQRTNFGETLAAIRSGQADIQQLCIRQHGEYHERLESRGPQPGRTVQCPHCGLMTALPLVQACSSCALIACQACVTDECNASHFPTAPTQMQEELELDAALQAAQPGAQFVLHDLQSGEKMYLDTQKFETMGFVHLVLDLPRYAAFFMNGTMIPDCYRPLHGDVIQFFAFEQPCDQCPLCMGTGWMGLLRVCQLCAKVGCRMCVADSCIRCTGGKVTCRDCHRNAADKHICAMHERHVNNQDAEVQMAEENWTDVLGCAIESQWQHLSILQVPRGRTTTHRGMYDNRGHILSRLEAAGYPPQEENSIFWGTSHRPDLVAAMAGYILVCPTSHAQDGMVHVVFRTMDGEVVRRCAERSGYDELSASLLSVSDMARGYILESSDVDLRSTGQIDLRNGVVISMAPPWRNRDRMPHPYAPPPSPTTTDQIPVRRGRRGEVREQVTALSGYVDVNGCFRVLCPPTAGQTWRQWLEREVMPPPAEVWATMDGRHLHDQHCLSGEPILIRLHFRARGGAKPDAMAKKLAAHLQEKGVPEDVSAERAQHIITAIGMPAVVEAYQTLDPWKSLKVAAGTRVRMVLQHELKSHREAGKVKKGDERPPDPWLISDPWKQSKQQQPQPQAQPLVISLVPGCFIDGMQEPVPILQHICTDANGVAIADFDEVEALAQSESFLSADELAAVVIGTTKPRTGTFACKDITFPAFHGKDKILLRGFMVTFGSRPVFLQQPKHSINIDVEEIAVVAMEMRKEFIADWPGAVKNPLKYTWSMIDGLQKATVTTWSRKFFAGRKESKPDEATSWHAFLKLPAAQLESFLTMSGRGGIFLTPKDAASSAPMGRFRVIWLDTLELEKAMKVHRMHPELLGLVRGRTSLGVRTHASDYSTLRRRLDPSWSSEGLSTDLVVARKWVIAPLPTQTDKKLLQEIINRLSWKAVPLKQISANSWLVGSGEDDCPPSDTFELGGKTSLISEQHGKRNEPVEEAIIAAPTAFKRTFQHHLAKKQPVQSVVPESLQDATLSVTQAPGPSKAMRDEFSGRLADLQEQLQSAINTVNERVTSAVATMSDRVTSVESQAATMSTEVQATVLGQSQRIQQLETSMQTISGSMVTKADLAEALKMAMESQANDIRLMLNPKRSPEVSPSHGAKASRTA